MLSLLAALLLALPATDCSALAGWRAGRGGAAATAACAALGDYREAHRLGQALHELQHEQAAVATRLLQAPASEYGSLRRRQRQLDTDLEAIRGLATIKGWPLPPVPEPSP